MNRSATCTALIKRKPADSARAVIAVTPDVGPGKPFPDAVVGLPSPILTGDSRGRRVDLDDRRPTWVQQLAGPLEQTDRTASDPDVPVRQEHVGPRTAARHRGEDIAMQRRAAPLHGHLHRCRRHIDPEGMDTPVGQRGGESTRTTSDVHRRSRAQFKDGVVGPTIVVGRSIAT